MANRKMPFGYCMRDGHIHILENEAEVVRMIFASYAAGSSYEALAEWLNDGTTTYFPEKRWNKNMVARILQDDRYLGNDSYPSILTADAFRARKCTNSGKLNHPQIKDIRILARCGVCGEAVRRERVDSWRCPHCMISAVKTSDKQLIQDVSELLQGVCKHPEAVAFPPITDTEESGVLTARKSFAHELGNTDFDESAAKKKAISLAAAQFNALGSEDYETMRIQYILARTEQNDELNTELLRQITSAILISSSGEISLKLKNGQILKRSDLT